MRAWLVAVVRLVILAVLVPSVATSQVTRRPPGPRPFVFKGDTAPPNVFFSPATGYTDTSTTTANVTVTITFGDACSLPIPPGGPNSLTLNGVNVRSQFTYTGGGDNSNCTGVSASATGTVSLRVGTNADTLYASIVNGGGHTGSATAVYSYLPVYHAPPRHALKVSVAAGAMHAAPGSTAQVAFTVTNIGNTTDTVYTKTHCYGYGLVPHCYTVPDSAFGLVPGGVYSGTSYVSVSDSVGQMGRLETIAYEPSHAGVTDTGYTDITVQNPLGAGVVLNGITPDVTRPRDKCLTIEILPGVAYSCGDLRVAHQLPSARTYNALRTPAFVYNSNSAVGVYAIGALVTFNSSMGTPDTVKATIIDSASGATIGQNTWPGSYWVNGATQRVTVRANELGNESGARWAYTFTATAVYIKAKTTQSYTATGAQISVSQATGPGFTNMLAGREYLVIPQWLGATPWNSTKPLYWQNAEGDTRQYNAVPGDSLVWAAAGVDRPDTIKMFNTSTMYGAYRYAAHGVVVHFDPHGPELGVTDRLGHETLIADTVLTGDPDSYKVVIPTPSGGLPFTFATGGYHPLDSVVAPAVNGQSRTVRFKYDTLNLYKDTIIDPDGSFVVYTWLNGQPHLPGYDLMTSYQDKRGTITAFHYDSAFRLIKAVIDTGAAPHLNLTWTFTPAESRGYTTPVAPDSAYTLVSRPRANAGDSADVTRYWVDQWGEPTRIRDAHGYETVLTRANPTYPALITYARFANGRVEAATYDPRGNDSTLTDSSTIVNNVAATTVWRYDHVWDFDTLTTLPAGEQTHVTLDPSTGNRLSQQVGSDPARRVTFVYGSYGLVTGVTQPLTPAATLAYDQRLGNDSITTSPLGFTDSTYRDAIGRDTMDVSPNDSAQTQFTRVSHRYNSVDDLVDEITSAQQPAAESSYVHKHYTVDGLVDSTERWASPDVGAIGHIRTSTQYDALGRAIVEVAQDGNADTLGLDAAGNVIRHVTRRGLSITSVYDALDRLVQRLTPAVSYSADTMTFGVSPRIPNCQTTRYCIPADTATFAYDAAGNQVVALNGDAWVRRHYNQNATLATDSSWIRTIAALDSGGNFTSHVYGLSFTYDLDGRRTALTYPTQLLRGTTTTSLTYGYDAATGLLQSISDLFGNTYSYTYDAAQRLWVTRYPGTITDSVTYDPESRIVQRIEQTHYGANPPANAFTTALRNETTNYDARDKVLHLTQVRALTDSFASRYTGLGHVDSTHHTCAAAGAGCHPIVETWVTDALGRVLQHFTDHNPDGGVDGSPTPEVKESLVNTYQGQTDRLLSSALNTTIIPCTRNGGPCSSPGPSTYTYDASGNTVSGVTTSDQSENSSPPDYQIRHFFSADDRERAADVQGPSTPTLSTAPFEEMRYDALGRRIWRHNRSLDGESILAVSDIQRYIWDGDQIVYETRGPGDDSIPLATLEADTLADGSVVGGVAYVHGPATDRPLAVQRFGYAPFASFAMAVHYDYHGQPDVVSFANGASMLCTDASDSTCVGSGMVVTQLMPIGPSNERTLNPNQWNGSLLVQQENVTGHQYKRNRYYDPTSGQFTQEDPTGLAGGLSAYGFASGDPVNYDDPTGLDAWDYRIVLDQQFAGGADECPPCVAAGIILAAAEAAPVIEEHATEIEEEATEVAETATSLAEPAVEEGASLVRNLAKSGQVRAAGEAAHHIVAKAAQAAAPARAVLAKVGIGINNAANGVNLPAVRSAVTEAVNHLTLHTKEYYNAVNDAFLNVQTHDQALQVLGQIRDGLLNGSFPH